MAGEYWRNLAAGLAALGVMAGCAGAGGAHKPEPALPGTESCIMKVNLYDFTVLDDSTLIIYGPLHKDAYLVKLFAPIYSLPFRQTIGFDTPERNGQLCKGDYVFVRGDLPERMPINTLRALTPDEAKQLIADSKRSRNAAQPAAVPPAATSGSGSGPNDSGTAPK